MKFPHHYPDYVSFGVELPMAMYKPEMPKLVHLIHSPLPEHCNINYTIIYGHIIRNLLDPTFRDEQ